MTFRQAIDLFVDDMFAQGRFKSASTERAYRATLKTHAEDVDNRDPAKTGREDVKRTLRRWKNPNSQYTRRAHLVSFYRWMVEEGYRPYNPAQQTRPPKKTKPEVYRLTRDEVVRMLNSCRGSRERWAIHLGICAGLRRQEILGLQGRHFQRPDFVWISPDIGKGGRGRYVTVIPELEPIVREIAEQLEPDDYVIPAQRWRDPGINRQTADKRKHPASEQALWRLVKTVGRRAGVQAEIGPHTLRHAFGDHMARYAGIELTRALLGHSDIGTTKTYVGEPTLDELAAAIGDFHYARAGLSLEESGSNPVEAPTGIEPVDRASQVLERFFASKTLRDAVKTMEAA